MKQEVLVGIIQNIPAAFLELSRKSMAMMYYSRHSEFISGCLTIPEIEISLLSLPSSKKIVYLHRRNSLPKKLYNERKRLSISVFSSSTQPPLLINAALEIIENLLNAAQTRLLLCNKWSKPEELVSSRERGQSVYRFRLPKF